MAIGLADLSASKVDDDYRDVIRWYAAELDRPAVFPWAGLPYEPVRIGPTWQTTPDGHWVLPDASIGWQQIGWACTRLKHPTAPQPFRFTLEQARWLLWWGAVDEGGRFLFRDAVLQRLKGWGKDPIATVLSLLEAFGPARFLEFDPSGDPVATDVPQAWVQLAAVSLEQTKNTTRLFPALLTPATKDEYSIRVGKQHIWGLGDDRFIQAVTSSPTTIEGARSTLVIENETQHWLANNEGHEMAAVVERNQTKSPDGGARSLKITNAPEPSEDSVGLRDREQYEAVAAGELADVGLMYDSLEAPPEAPLSPEAAPAVIVGVRGDSVWLDPIRIVQSIMDGRNPPSRSRRFWYNQVVATEDAWVDPIRFRSIGRPLEVAPTDELVLFFDGSKSDDATGLVGCRMSDGHAVTLGLWRRPPGERGEGWTAPRATIDHRVDEVFAAHRIVGFWADPSHTQDDETGERYWDALIDDWHARYSARLDERIWAIPRRHSILWDMASPANTQEFTAAAERCVSDIDAAADLVADGGAPSFTWDNDLRLFQHVRNAKQYPNRYGTSLWKGHRESKSKIDLAVCMVGARMLRRRLILAPEKKTKQAGRGGAWGGR